MDPLDHFNDRLTPSEYLNPRKILRDPATKPTLSLFTIPFNVVTVSLIPPFHLAISTVVFFSMSPPRLNTIAQFRLWPTVEISPNSPGTSRIDRKGYRQASLLVGLLVALPAINE